ncbi:MAG: lysophospholipid acyltransferase family protein [Planctomycetota bacterium]|jgi:1-acyl-sn-glycerol-3-phosphate acyltransferase
MSQEIDHRKVTPPLQPIGAANRIFYSLQVFFIGAFLKVFCRMKVCGEKLPPRGPLIVAANHESLIDPVVLQIALRRRMHYLMTSDFYFKPWMNRYFRVMRCIPVMEERFNREALRSALDVLSAQRPIGIFPQGGLREAGDFSCDNHGIALLAKKSRNPVYPVRIIGTGRVLPRGARILHPSPIEVRVGPPLFPAKDGDVPGNQKRQYLKTVTSRIMNAISKL